MFSGMEWYWWLIIIAVTVLSIPFKIRFMKWWGKRHREQNGNRRDRWGDEE